MIRGRNNFPGPGKAAQVTNLGKPQCLQSPPGGSRSHAAGTVQENGPVRFPSSPAHAPFQFTQGNIFRSFDPVDGIFSRGAHINKYAPGPEGLRRLSGGHPPESGKEDPGRCETDQED